MKYSRHPPKLSFDSLLELVDSKQPLPLGWEKCLDLKSGAVYFQNRVTGDKSYIIPSNLQPNQSSTTQFSKIHLPSDRIHGSKNNRSVVVDLELGLGAPTTKNEIKTSSASMTSSSRRHNIPLLQIEIEDLDLRLTLRPMSSFQQQAEQVALPPPPPPPSPSHVSNSSSSSSPSSSTTHVAAAEPETCEAESRKPKRQRTGTTSQEWPVMVTVGCRQCLMYVMLSKDNLRCPKCGSRVPLDFIPAGSHL